MAITIFSDAFTKMDDTIINILGNQTAALMSVISPIIIACFGLYLLLIAMSYIKGGAEPIDLGVDLIYRFIAWAVILGVAMNIGNYTNIVVTIVNELPTELANTISGTPATPVTNGLDGLLDLYYNAMQKMFDEVGFADVGGMVLAAVVCAILLICAVPFIVASAAFMLLAKIMSAVLLVLGPIFIVLALFPATRQYFSLWVGQVVNYVLMLVVLQILATIQISFLTDVMNTSVDLTMLTSLTIGAASMLFFVVVLKVPDLTSALSNGMAITGFGSAYRALGAGRGGQNSRGGGGGGGDSDKGKSSGKNTIRSEKQGLTPLKKS